MNDLARPIHETSHAGRRNAGALAANLWLSARNVSTPRDARWTVAVALEVVDRAARPTAGGPDDSRFQIAISSSEWGFLFGHRGRVSRIRVTDVPHVQERDDHKLLPRVPPLRDLGSLIRWLEREHGLAFRRAHAFVGTDLADAEPRIRTWIATAL
jgi:hypothetical protein